MAHAGRTAHALLTEVIRASPASATGEEITEECIRRLSVATLVELLRLSLPDHIRELN